MRNLLLCSILALAGSSCVQMQAQTPTQAPEPPKLTELQKAHIELYMTQIDSANLRFRVQLAGEIRPYQDQLLGEIEAVKKANPGWDYHFAASPQDHSGWVKPQTSAPASTPFTSPAAAQPVTLPTAPAPKK